MAILAPRRPAVPEVREGERYSECADGYVWWRPLEKCGATKRWVRTWGGSGEWMNVACNSLGCDVCGGSVRSKVLRGARALRIRPGKVCTLVTGTIPGGWVCPEHRGQYKGWSREPGRCAIRYRDEWRKLRTCGCERVEVPAGRVVCREDVDRELDRWRRFVGAMLRETSHGPRPWDLVYWAAEVVAKPLEERSAVECPVRLVDPPEGHPEVPSEAWQWRHDCVSGRWCGLCQGTGYLPRANLHMHALVVSSPYWFGRETPEQALANLEAEYLAGKVGPGWRRQPDAQAAYRHWRRAVAGARRAVTDGWATGPRGKGAAGVAASYGYEVIDCTPLETSSELGGAATAYISKVASAYVSKVAGEPKGWDELDAGERSVVQGVDPFGLTAAWLHGRKSGGRLGEAADVDARRVDPGLSVVAEQGSDRDLAGSGLTRADVLEWAGAPLVQVRTLRRPPARPSFPNEPDLTPGEADRQDPEPLAGGPARGAVPGVQAAEVAGASEHSGTMVPGTRAPLLPLFYSTKSANLRTPSVSGVPNPPLPEEVRRTFAAPGTSVPVPVPDSVEWVYRESWRGQTWWSPTWLRFPGTHERWVPVVGDRVGPLASTRAQFATSWRWMLVELVKAAHHVRRVSLLEEAAEEAWSTMLRALSRAGAPALALAARREWGKTPPYLEEGQKLSEAGWRSLSVVVTTEHLFSAAPVEHVHCAGCPVCGGGDNGEKLEDRAGGGR